MKWFKKESHLWYAILTTFVVFVFCCGIGLGLFLGIDSKNAEVKQLKAEKKELTIALTEGVIIITLLEIRLKSLVDLMKYFMGEEEKSKDYNDTALD